MDGKFDIIDSYSDDSCIQFMLLIIGITLFNIGMTALNNVYVIP